MNATTEKRLFQEVDSKTSPIDNITFEKISSVVGRLVKASEAEYNHEAKRREYEALLRDPTFRP